MTLKNRYQPYEERFIKFSSKVEHILKKLLISFLIFLFVSQILLQFSTFRKLLIPIEKIEGAITFEIDFPF